MNTTNKEIKEKEERLLSFKQEVEGLRDISDAEEYAKQLAHLFLGNGLSLQTVLLMAIDFGQQHPNWFSVEDELPEITINDWRSDDLLFVTDDGVVRYGFYRDGGVWFSSVRGFSPNQVTHWMQLPQPPRKED